MSDAVDQPREDIAAATDTAAAQTSAPADTKVQSSDFDNAIAEFDVATAKSATPTIEDLFQPSAENVDRLLGQDGTAADAVRHANEIEALRGGGLAAEMHAHELAQRGSRLEQAVSEMQHREWMRQEQSDFQSFVREANEGLSEFRHLPPDFAERWLMSKSLRDSKLRAYWDHRNNQQLDAGTRGAISRYLKGALQRLWKSVREMPDPQLTADVNAVSQAVRGAAGKFDAVEPPPRLGELSDKSLNDFTKQFGFRAI